MSCHKLHIFQSAAAATANGTAADCTPVSDGPYYSATVQIVGITTATVTWEGTVDGTNWVAVRATNLNAGTDATTATADGIYRLTVLGFKQVRARISAYTSGTITVTGMLADM